MNYTEAVDYVLSFTDFEKLPPAYWSREFDLRRMYELLDRLNNPHQAWRSVIVAGSKGKGSTASMIASGLSASGYRTGLYTSPHLHTIRERIRIGERLITEEELTAIVERLKPGIEAVNSHNAYGQLTTFEILTAMAFMYFRDEKVEFAVLEVGLGGRLDATNVVKPEVAVITSISMDHVEVLGDTLAKIAREKAGVIKQGVVCVVSPQRAEAAEVIAEVCRDRGARMIMVGVDVTWRKLASDINRQVLGVKGTLEYYKVTIPLLGDHQLENASTAVAALESLGCEAESIVSGLSHVSWPGRLEVVGESPLFVVDGAHNDDSARRLKEALKSIFNFERCILIMGMSSDKNMAAIVGELAAVSSIAITTRSRHPRALKPIIIAEEFHRHGVRTEVTESVSRAAERALKLAGTRDLICATGSLFVVAEAREYARNISGEVYIR